MYNTSRNNIKNKEILIMQKIFTLALSSFSLFTLMGTEPTFAKSFTFQCPGVDVFQSVEDTCEGPAGKQTCKFTARQAVEGEDLIFSVQQIKPSRTSLPFGLKLIKKTDLKVPDEAHVSCSYSGKPNEKQNHILKYMASASLPSGWNCNVEGTDFSCTTKD